MEAESPEEEELMLYITQVMNLDGALEIDDEMEVMTCMQDWPTEAGVACMYAAHDYQSDFVYNTNARIFFKSSDLEFPESGDFTPSGFTKEYESSVKQPKDLSTYSEQNDDLNGAFYME